MHHENRTHALRNPGVVTDLSTGWSPSSSGRDNGDNVAMRILVTGAAGTLASVTIPRLVERGHDVLSPDVRRGSADWTWTIADVRDAEAVSGATEHADVIVHAAAFHGIHL